MPSKHERKEHRIESLKAEGVTRSFPRRFMFFDSESLLENPDGSLLDTRPKPEAVDDSELQAEQPEVIYHKPRLICTEYWERRPDGSVRDGAYAQCHATTDPGGRWKVREPLREGEVEEAFGEGRFDAGDPLCAAFWKNVGDCAIYQGHAASAGTLYLLAHNVGYDAIATGIYRELPKLGWVMERPYSKGPVYIQRATHQGEGKSRSSKAKLIILSSTNYFSAALKDVAKDMGLPEKIEFKDFNTKDLQTLEEYCRRDVEIVRKAMLWLCRMLEQPDLPDEKTGRRGLRSPTHTLGPFKLTISSIAFSCWRYNFLDDDMPIWIHIDPEAIRLERAAFGGGRTEADIINVPLDDVDCYDVNNLYGSIMFTNRVPRKLVRVIPPQDAPSPDVLKRWVTNPDSANVYIAEVDVDMSEPAVPFKDGTPDKPGKLLFPIGKFSTTLCGPELRLAFEHGRVLKVHGVAEYRAGDIFHDYVDYMSKKRVDAVERGHKAEKTLYKAMNNHVYGKFGQKSEEWVRIGDCPPGEKYRREAKFLPDHIAPVVFLYTPMGVYESSGVPEESFNAFPAIAAYITSGARTRLWGLMQIAKGWNPQNRRYARPHSLYYRDTDSLMVDRAGSDALSAAGELHESELGKLKHEWHAEHMIIGGAKWYGYVKRHEQHDSGKVDDCEVGYSWVNGEAVKNVHDTHDPHLLLVEKHKGVGKLWKKVQTKNGPRYEGQQWRGLAGHLQSWEDSSGRAHNGDIGHFHNTRILKKADATYTKGVISADGWVAPHRLDNQRPLTITVEAQL